MTLPADTDVSASKHLRDKHAVVGLGDESAKQPDKPRQYPQE